MFDNRIQIKAYIRKNITNKILIISQRFHQNTNIFILRKFFILAKIILRNIIMKLTTIKKLFLTLLTVPGIFLSANAKAACVDFAGIADDTVLGNTFVLNGFAFQAQPGNQVFVNVFNDINGDLVHGAQFENTGIQVILPAASAQVDIEIGVFNTPGVRIRALDAAGLVVDMLGVPADNQLHNVALSSVANPIASIQMRGGGNEAVINEICN
jgi:hypothetical protein